MKKNDLSFFILHSAFCIQEDSAPLNAQSALCKPANRFGICLAFGREDPRRQTLGGVVVENRHDTLRHDGTAIVFIVGEMNRAAGYLDAHLQGGAMDRQAMKTLATKSRNERGMNVQNAVEKIIGDVQQLEESGQADEIDLSLPAVREETRAEVLARGTRLAIDDEGGNVGLPGTGQAKSVRLVRDDAGDFRGQHTAGDAIEEVVQSCAAATEQDGQTDRLVHNGPPRWDGDAIGRSSPVIA